MRRPSERRRSRRVGERVVMVPYEVGVYFDGTLAFYARARAVEAARGDVEPAEDEAVLVGEVGTADCVVKFGSRYASQIADAAKAGRKIGISVGGQA